MLVGCWCDADVRSGVVVVYIQTGRKKHNVRYEHQTPVTQNEKKQVWFIKVILHIKMNVFGRSAQCALSPVCWIHRRMCRRYSQNMFELCQWYVLIKLGTHCNYVYDADYTDSFIQTFFFICRVFCSFLISVLQMCIMQFSFTLGWSLSKKKKSGEIGGRWGELRQRQSLALQNISSQNWVCEFFINSKCYESGLYPIAE